MGKTLASLFIIIWVIKFVDSYSCNVYLSSSVCQGAAIVAQDGVCKDFSNINSEPVSEKITCTSTGVTYSFFIGSGTCFGSPYRTLDLSFQGCTTLPGGSMECDCPSTTPAFPWWAIVIVVFVVVNAVVIGVVLIVRWRRRVYYRPVP